MRTLVLGIGNPHLADDAVGLVVAESVKGRVDTRLLTTTGFDVLGALLGYDRAVIVDGIRSGAAPGTVFELDPAGIAGGAVFAGTHSLGLGTTLALGYRLFGDEMPARIRIVAVEVVDTETFGRGLSPAVAASLPEAVRRVERFLAPGSDPGRIGERL